MKTFLRTNKSQAPTGINTDLHRSLMYFYLRGRSFTPWKTRISYH